MPNFRWHFYIQRMPDVRDRIYIAVYAVILFDEQ